MQLFYSKCFKAKVILVILIFIGTSEQFLSAQNKLDSLEKALQKTNNDTNTVNILQQLGGIYRRGDPQKAQQLAEKSLKLAQKLNYPKGVGFGYVELGILADMQGNYKKALSLYEKAEPVFLKHQLLRGQAAVKQNRAMLYYYQSDYLAAQRNYLDALRILEQIGDKAAQASVLNNLGALFEDKKDYQKALSYFLQSLKIKESLDNPISLASTLNNIGNIYISLKKVDTAEKYFYKSLENAEKYHNQRSVAIALANLGRVHSERKQFEKALELYQKSMGIEEAMQNEEGIGVCWVNIGHVLLQTNKTDEAINYLEKGLKVMEKIDYKIHIQNALEYLAEGYAKKKNFEKSYAFQKRYSAIHDSIYTEESNRKIAEMQTLYETEKKDKQIAVQELTIKNQRNRQYFLLALAVLLLILGVMLWRRYQFRLKINRILDEKNQELIKLNAIKDKLFAIIAHDLKNPLSAFRSITQSLSENVLAISKEEIDYFLKQLNHSASHLFDLLQNLLSWAISQVGKLPFLPEKIHLKSIIQENIELLKANAQEKQITIIEDIETDTTVEVDKQMLRTIIRNLLSNAIKFTTENGKIHIYGKMIHNLLEISIEDNGIGIAEEDALKLFKIEEDVSQIGNSGEKGTGLGLLLCKELVEKNQGEIGVSSELNKGSRFYFTIPKV
jgi:signal transduction histidine kinase/uncharacterized protein HemY